MSTAHSPALDQAQEVRPGEELNLENLQSYLAAHVAHFSPPVTIGQFRKGYSNLTYLVSFGGRDYILRRPPFGANIKSAHDMGREFRILSGLHPVFAKVPRPLVYCQDESILGAPFYLMERVHGIILRAKPPEGISLTPEVMARVSDIFIRTLVEIHQLDVHQAQLADLGKPEGYVTRQVDGWIKRYQNARTDDLPAMETVGRWLAENKPAESGPALIHNDFKYDNLVLSETLTEVRACLDWEMATLGDPLMDLGSTLGYWVNENDPEHWRQQAFGLTTLPGNYTREQLLAAYEKHTGKSVPNPVFYFAYGLFKLAVIVQQIYARYRAGHTRDERFARLIELVKSASLMAARSIETKSL